MAMGQTPKRDDMVRYSQNDDDSSEDFFMRILHVYLTIVKNPHEDPHEDQHEDPYDDSHEDPEDSHDDSS